MLVKGITERFVVLKAYARMSPIILKLNLAGMNIMLKKLLTRMIITAAVAATSITAIAQSAPQAPVANNAQQPSLVPSPPNVNAQAYVLMDVNSGTIIAQKNMDVRRPPASLTKLMTLFLTSRAAKSGVIKLSDKVLISKKAWQTGGSRMFVKVNSRVPVRLLTEGIIVDSGNDATMALAQYVGGSTNTFVDMMNQEAKVLDMTNTHYVDPTGLPAPDHYSSAHDLAKLTRAIWLDFPAYHDWYKQKWLSYNGIRQPNRNRLLWRYPYALGMKTGHTNEAGYCLIAVAKKDGETLLSVVMGAPTDEDRSSDSIRLLSYGFRFYNTHLLYQANSTIAKPRVWYGENETVPAGTVKDIYVTTPRGQFTNTKVEIALNKDIKAPVKKGAVLGAVNVTLSGKQIASYPLIALTNDKKGGVWRRSVDSVSHKFHNWFGSKKKNKQVKMQTPTNAVAPASTQTAANVSTATPAPAQAAANTNTTSPAPAQQTASTATPAPAQTAANTNTTTTPQQADTSNTPAPAKDSVATNNNSSEAPVQKAVS
jgi:serine-type D-Ala-D-Ala carboxypeptidase (penicillin-binding protein 5/6)